VAATSQEKSSPERNTRGQCSHTTKEFLTIPCGVRFFQAANCGFLQKEYPGTRIMPDPGVCALSELNLIAGNSSAQSHQWLTTA